MSRLVPVLFVLLFSCSENSAEPKSVDSTPKEVETIVCPVNGVPFPKGHGIMIEGKERTFEVCSKGCKYQYELELDPEPNAGK
jgi:hypothetical protein